MPGVEKPWCVPIVGVESLELGEIAVEGRNILGSNAPKSTNLQDVPWTTELRKVALCESAHVLATTRSSRGSSPWGSNKPVSMSPTFKMGTEYAKTVSRDMVGTLSWASKMPHFFKFDGCALTARCS